MAAAAGASRVLTQQAMSRRASSILSVLIALALALTAAGRVANAATAQIVAFGASNTAGYGVGADQAWPARLEAMLRAKGYQAAVANAGISGDTTVGMLERLDSAIPEGTGLVILAIFPYNDAGKGISLADHAANIQKILDRIHGRSIPTISAIPFVSDLPRQPDSIHLTAEGHAMLAERLLPQVIDVIGRR
jgi:acyl-CoA thioesterase I